MRPAVNPAVEGRTEIEGFQRVGKSDIAGIVQPHLAQFTHREGPSSRSALSVAHDLLDGRAVGLEETLFELAFVSRDSQVSSENNLTPVVERRRLEIGGERAST